MKLNLESFISHYHPVFPSSNLLLKVNSVLQAHGLGCFQSHIMEHVDARLLLGYKSHDAFGLSLDFPIVGFLFCFVCQL